MPVPSLSELDERLLAIEQLDMAGLRAIWARRFGQEPPTSLSRRLLELAAAYDLQESMSGRRNAGRRRLLQPIRKEAGASRSDRKGAPPGSRLVREWQGHSHTIEVIEEGFLYMGQRYRSLSEIARAITGTRWSGPRFFGL